MAARPSQSAAKGIPVGSRRCPWGAPGRVPGGGKCKAWLRSPIRSVQAYRCHVWRLSDSRGYTFWRHVWALNL